MRLAFVMSWLAASHVRVSEFQLVMIESHVSPIETLAEFVIALLGLLLFVMDIYLFDSTLGLMRPRVSRLRSAKYCIIFARSFCISTERG